MQPLIGSSGVSTYKPTGFEKTVLGIIRMTRGGCSIMAILRSVWTRHSLQDVLDAIKALASAGAIRCNSKTMRWHNA